MGKKTEGRIGKVFQYIHQHSADTVSLGEMAALINLSESAFCKFFKRTTGKTFSDYLTDIRIGQACHLLSESDETISEVAYRSGFESLTYFNRVFLRKKGMRPREFRKGINGVVGRRQSIGVQRVNGIRRALAIARNYLRFERVFQHSALSPADQDTFADQ